MFDRVTTINKDQLNQEFISGAEIMRMSHSNHINNHQRIHLINILRMDILRTRRRPRTKLQIEAKTKFTPPRLELNPRMKLPLKSQRRPPQADMHMPIY
jgi:hypothetical protein